MNKYTFFELIGLGIEGCVDAFGKCPWEMEMNLRKGIKERKNPDTLIIYSWQD